ncbi:Mitogen-activated protein kinase kinase kinase [Trema orientale]|uniref:Mitogen-activated protein kinase kinase kinase n=1 Tax=Trema orientale TaxID=63057 RepID=A0A2P5CWB9_TREOI|nr:Mitogen-activated protein kinase kinase kinase [Trema orientale]
MNSTIASPVGPPLPRSHPSALFPLISSCKTMRDLNQVHAHFIKTGQIHDPLAAAEVLRFCALSSEHRDLEYARQVFDEMREPNCFSWNTIIRGLAESSVDDEEAQQPLGALLLFRQMVSVGSVEPNQFTFPSVLKACARTGSVEMGKQVHGLVLKYGLDEDVFVLSNLVRMYVMCGAMEGADVLFFRNVSDYGNVYEVVRDKRRKEGNVVLWNVMVDGYVRIGDFQAARELFDKMPQRSVVSWNVMISGYAQNGLFKEAIELFRDMQLGEVCPNYVTLVSVLPAISRLGALELGKWVHLYAEKNKIEMNDVLGSALVDMYSKCGSIEKALQVFESLPKENAITWNAIIGGFAMHGRAKDALHCFSRMQKAGVTPTDVTYIGLLSACSHGGLVGEGRSFFKHMVSVDGLEPRIEHYGCMVDLLGRAGHLEEAEELILNMPIKQDDVIWKALLGACKMHKNIDIGKRVAEILMNLAPHDGGSYVALSNLYASSGNWEAVSEVRLRMKDMDIRKDPGCSWIELDGVIHEFLVEDDSHSRAKEIHSMLEEISYELRLAGYRPKTEQVLLNMDEEEKQSTLQYHSEKIAIAFGLISTGHETPIRIVKNLRICEDCHASIKLISQIYKRKIIVRDRKRFHHFEHGTCSCMDYCSSSTLNQSSTVPVRSPSSYSVDAVLLLEKIKASLQGNSENLLLSSWNSTAPVCQWRGLKWVFSNGSPLLCDDVSSPQWTNLSLFRDPSLHLLSLQLPSANLSGALPRELGEFTMLQSLYLNVNSLKGTIPLELGYSSSLSDIDLGNNLLNGVLAPSIWNLCNKLVSLRLHGNSLSGSLPEPALPNSTCRNLQFLDLGDNKFTGNFPEFIITQFPALKQLDLGNNLFSGPIPQGLAELNLEKLDLSHNNFSGVLPVFGKSNFGREVFEENNPALCGLPLKSCSGNSRLSSGAIAGLVIGFMTGTVVLASFLIGYVQHKKKKSKAESEDELEEGEDEIGVGDDGNGGNEGGGGAAGEGKLILFQGGEHLTLDDVLNATGQVMEKTNYGTVYKAKLADGGTIALRLLREGSCKDRSSCIPVIKQLGRIRHENLIPLRAFYQGKRGEKLLIYDHLPHRSLHDYLHETRVGKPVLNWARRHKIALGIARGLAYLHTGLEAPITHGNVRSKNILIDDFFVARLTEFGLDKIMVPAVADEIVALAKTDGYKAPELQRMKKCNSRTDVYAFGIMLLEILIGKKPGKSGRSGEFVDLPSMVKVAVLEETTMEVFDVEVLKGIRSPMEEGLIQALKLAMGCCAPVPSVRPTMDEVVKQLEENRPRNRSALYSPTETRSEIGTPF